jgi:D-glycero-alpha-D-manno-heptose-7-phosphate kinase
MTYVLTRTPYRISFFGGGSDYPEWYLKNGGAVLSSTIDKYCYISARELPKIAGTLHRIVWRHVEQVESLHDILHPAVREGMKHLNFTDATGLEIHYQGDLPARSGMGSSSTFAVGFLHALHRLRGEKPSAHSLALEAIHLERNLLKESVGSQDQVAAAHGGLNQIHFKSNGDIDVQPVEIPASTRETLNAHLLLFFTGRERTASKVANAIINNLDDRKDYIQRMQAMVGDGIALLKKGDIENFGKLLHEGWTLKKALSDQVSTSFIDVLYETARRNGAIGGKLLGAGQAGFMCFLVPPQKHDQVVTALGDLGTFVPAKLATAGSEVVYCSAESSPHQ